MSLIWKFNAINPATDEQSFMFQANAVGGSGYNETITSTFFYTWNNGGDYGLNYEGSNDQAQGTAFQPLTMNMHTSSHHAAGAYSHWTGILYLFSPSSTTYVKQFYSRVVASRYSDDDSYTFTTYAAGYFNLTAAIDEIQFKPTSDNFDGTIKMYGCR